MSKWLGFISVLGFCCTILAITYLVQAAAGLTSGHGYSTVFRLGIDSINPFAQKHHYQPQYSPTYDLDLSDTTRTYPAGRVIGKKPVQIKLGNNTKMLFRGDKLTPAEFITAFEISSLGQQSLQLDEAGAVTGGVFVLPAELKESIGQLVIPSGVNIIHDTRKGSSLKLLGPLINSGKLTVLVGNDADESENVLSAMSIANRSNAVIEVRRSVQRDNEQPASGRLISIESNQSIKNNGLISLADSSRITAFSGINNDGIINSTQNMDICCGASGIVNSGEIASSFGNIRFSEFDAPVLKLNNSGGRLIASEGTIDFNCSEHCPKLELIGGSIESQRIMLHNPNGTVELSSQLVPALNSEDNRNVTLL